MQNPIKEEKYNKRKEEILFSPKRKEQKYTKNLIKKLLNFVSTNATVLKIFHKSMREIVSIP